MDFNAKKELFIKKIPILRQKRRLFLIDLNKIVEKCVENVEM
jgi:hypothetical protein